MLDEHMTVLVVEDQPLNRRMIKKSVSEYFDVIEAENGKQALELIEQNGNNISAILLDLIMPVMNGYTFLDVFKDTEYASIPVIVMTGEAGSDAEQQALDLGASDFVTKPYEPGILLRRLNNAIARSKMFLLEKMQFMTEHDELTGLYNRYKAFAEIRRLIDSNKDEKFVFVRLDIDRFRLLNSLWGVSEGDRVLKSISDLLLKHTPIEEQSFSCRIESDIFAFFEPYDENKINNKIDALEKEIESIKLDYKLKASFGVYVIDETDIEVEEMFIRASMAAEKCKKHYVNYVGYYDESMGDRLYNEQLIEKEMQNAIESNQFVVYLQPKFNIITEEPSGAEALVRWVHPNRGVISPGMFIPVFERNGFISKLDIFMWESVCKIIRSWIDHGKNPMPVSVNMSRVSMYNPNIANILKNVTIKYRIDPKYIHIELTETAYMEDPILMQKTVENLQDNGFTILMDDFGSGYSSLNTLKDMSVDVLKIDMRFISGDFENDRCKQILSSVIKMADELELPVIVEGVETASQKNFLKSVGCEYVQGFYYAKPMPVNEYETLIKEYAEAL